MASENPETLSTLFHQIEMHTLNARFSMQNYILREENNAVERVAYYDLKHSEATEILIYIPSTYFTEKIS